MLPIALLLLVVSSAGAADKFVPNPEEISVATTGRIVKIDAKNKTMRVRGNDGQNFSVRGVSQNLGQVIQGLKQHIGVTLPGGITIAFPGRGKAVAKADKKPPSALDEFNVIVTNETVFQDGAETIRFEDFHNGDVISLHGTLKETTLTASRIAKWF